VLRLVHEHILYTKGMQGTYLIVGLKKASYIDGYQKYLYFMQKAGA
jgi:hypothetical protein